MSEQRCGYTVADQDGEQGPCDRPGTSWRWYQDVEHEDCLDVACEWHENEGGLRMYRLTADLVAARKLIASLSDSDLCLVDEDDE